jgi:2,4-dienoyl-CoA reductase (NADPH2)
MAFAQHWGLLSGGVLPEAKPAYRITMLKRSDTPFGNTLGRTTGWVHRAELARNGVKMLKGVAYERIDDGGLHITLEGKGMVIPADTIIVCAGQTPYRPLPSQHLIGGAKEAGELDAKRAMLEGAELAAAI